MWNKFHEGWKRKGGEEMGEKWRRSKQLPTIDRSSAMCRPVDERFVGNSKERKKKEEREREKMMGDGG